MWEPTIGEDAAHRTIIYLFWAAGGLLSIECLRFPRARGPARVAENSPQTHNRGAWVPCLCPWRRLGVSAAQGRRLNLFIYLINFMSVETTFNGPRTIRFEILIPTLTKNQIESFAAFAQAPLGANWKYAYLDDSNQFAPFRAL